MIYAKDLENCSKAVGLFNLGTNSVTATANWAELKLRGKRTVRDLWRQKDLGQFDRQYSATVPPHGVVLIRFDKRHRLPYF